MNELEQAWAAGFFDGEGSSFVHRDRLCVSVGQSSSDGLPQVLTRFQAAVGGGIIAGPYLRDGRNYKPKYEFRAFGYDARIVIERLWPYLGDVKREQATRALASSTPTDRPNMKTRLPKTHCLRGHEIAVVGRYKHGTCKGCAREDREARRAS